MSVIRDAKVKKPDGKPYKFHIERYESAMEVVEKCRTRKMTSDNFHNMKTKSDYDNWDGVGSYEEALQLLHDGYQPTVEKMRDVFKAGKMGDSKRFAFQNSVVGFSPVVPLALKGVPNSMINMTMKPIKAKVVDVYYDMVASCGTSSEDIIKAGQTLLGTIIELERQGYRFNLYACQTYSDSNDADMLVVKVKDASKPLDLKRVSFPLTHTAFFRVIGFDWYSKLPGGRYRFAYGHALSYEFENDSHLKNIGKQLFGDNTVFLTATKILKMDKDHVKEVLGNGTSKD